MTEKTIEERNSGEWFEFVRTLGAQALPPPLEDVEFSKEQKKAFNALDENSYTFEDWKDLNRTMEALKVRIAKRHGIL